MIKLNKKPRPDDLTAVMPLRLYKDGDVLKDKDGKEGFIEFWAEDATEVKAGMTRFGARFTRLQAIRERRSEADWKAISDDALAKENDDWKALTTEGLALRVKSWHLVDTDGDAIDAPLTMENARSLFLDDDHELRDICLNWLKDNKSAFLPKKKQG